MPEPQEYGISETRRAAIEDAEPELCDVLERLVPRA